MLFIIYFLLLPLTLTLNQNIHSNTKKSLGKIQGFLTGERVGIRTRDPLIKSQMLYQLSYAPVIHCISQERGYVYKIKMT